MDMVKKMETASNFLYVASNAQSVIVAVAVLICNMIGVIVLMTTVGKSVWNYFHHERHVKLTLAHGIALALEFKLAAEILQTITAHDWNEIAVLGTIIVLRAAISLLIHWEIKTEQLAVAEESSKENRKL